MEKETPHTTNLLEKIKSSLNNKDSLKLKELSDHKIHSASSNQDPGSITLTIIVYALSKLLERGDYKKIKNWPVFVKKFNALLDLAILALNQNKKTKYQDYIQKARKLLESHSVNLKPYIQDVLKKASINKGSKVYEHGISLEQTAKILGVSQWELSDYIGQRDHAEVKHNKTIDTKQRARMALELFE